MPPDPFRTGYTATAQDGAALTFARPRKNVWTLHYTPAPQALKIASLGDSEFVAPSKPILLIEGHDTRNKIVIHPLNTSASSRNFLQPKYSDLRTLTLDGFGEFQFMDNSADGVVEAFARLPSGFVKDPYYGLGLLYELRFIVKAVEEIAAITDLQIRRGRTTGLPKIERHSYVLGWKTFDDIRKAINRTHENALDVATDEKNVLVHNALLTAVDPKQHPAKQRRYRKDAIIASLGGNLIATTKLSPKDEIVLVKGAATAVKSLKKREPQALLEPVALGAYYKGPSCLRCVAASARYAPQHPTDSKPANRTKS